MKWLILFCNFIVAFGTVGVVTLVLRLVVKRHFFAATLAWGISCALVAAGLGDSADQGPAWPDGLTPTVVVLHALASLTVASIPIIRQWYIERQRKAGLYWTADDEEPKPPGRRNLL
ncbi:MULTISPECIES: hypothetical protein [Myxococcus]|uniref:hypothetical protein n=1 Tax=Myxococcus TaxID=32 RepID=UPI0013D78C56|nr:MULTISPECIES: hypothetical protein [Myxococcus]NVJ24033.1 hypothetical protein [Myxococcus sp. AM011]